MIGERRDQDAENDGGWPVKLRGEDEGEQLRLIADLGEGDDTGGDEERSHGNSQAGSNR